MRVQFDHHNFHPASERRIAQANAILDDYRRRGYTLTLRQLYYQFVSSGLIENTPQSYKALGALMTKARDAGLVDWSAIEDRNRGLRGWSFCEDDTEVVNPSIMYQINVDFWKRQDAYVEVWVEKDALSQVISKPARRKVVPHMACKGYLSASEAFAAGQRFHRKAEEGKRCVLLHLGDHDPSGLDMTRDNDDRIYKYSFGEDVEIQRLALNMDQVEEHSPPPNPAKLTDSRSSGYVEKYGRNSWELDALDPEFIDDLITDAVDDLIDPYEWERWEALEDELREPLKKLGNNWDKVKEFLEGLE